MTDGAQYTRLPRIPEGGSVMPEEAAGSEQLGHSAGLAAVVQERSVRPAEANVSVPGRGDRRRFFFPAGARLCLLSVVGAALITACARGPDPELAFFEHWVIDPEPNTGKDCCTDVLALGDLSGDGQLDVIVGAEKSEAPGLVWYQYPSWEKHPVASGEFTTDGQAADIDGDSDLDIVIGNAVPGRETLEWFEHVSGPPEDKWIRHVIGTGYSHDVEVGDVDGDGDLDVVTGDKRKVIVWEQAGTGEFSGHIVVERRGEGIKLADIDGDGDLDIVYGASWLENPGRVQGRWTGHAIEEWPADTRVALADVNRDGRVDVVLSASEGVGGLSWFEAPADPRAAHWVEHAIEADGELEGAHSLQVADFDDDGDLDVLVAEMHTSRHRRILVYLNEGDGFRRALLAWHGSHNMRIGDIEGDGDIDIVGKNYAGPGRVIEMWENALSATGRWNYRAIDDARPTSQQGKMGLVAADVDRDGYTDVIAGSFLYRNPLGKLWGPWQRTELPKAVDVYFALDVDDDDRADLVGIAGETAYWIEADDRVASTWRATPVATVADARTQGYLIAQLVPGAKPQLVFTRGKKRLYAMEIPANPDQRPWPLHAISGEAEEEGLAAGDIDGDGDLDLAAVKVDGEHLIWLENPGRLSQEWTMHVVGDTPHWADRIALVDIDADGRLDLVCTVERQETTIADGLFWFQAPVSGSDPWTRHLIARHRSLNSLSLTTPADGEGTEIIVAEHTDLRTSPGAPDNLTLIYETADGGRSWVPEIVERGPHSSHLGAYAADLDNDGLPEILSLGWNQYQTLHLWTRTSKPAAQ
ncbi:hypothetical protein CKO22_11755 [Thiococcus pfennigii]|nr:hypothetical protein [Thiococcus pfennigii]